MVDIAVAAVAAIAAAAGFLVGWLVGFLNRRGHTRRVREKLQAEVSRLEEMVALKRLREYEAPRAGRESTLNWLAALPEQGTPRSAPARPQRQDAREGS